VAPKSFLLSDPLRDYVVGHSAPLDDVARDLIAETAALGDIAGLQIAPEQAAFMTLLTRAVGARTAIEVGTFTGLSALAVARGLPADGLLLCCDVNDEWTSIGRRAWQRAGLSGLIELKIGPAIDTLRSLPEQPAYDLAFLDADKSGYADYYDELVPRLRAGGLLLVDNTLAGGRVVDDGSDEGNVAAIRAFNDKTAADPAVETVLLPVADGLTFVRKR
jgi:caffeoyl-CoA O-methyltransferase